MCSLDYGETSWTPCCTSCGNPDAYGISKLCKKCYQKQFYQRNKVTILQKAKEYRQTPDKKVKVAAYLEKNKERVAAYQAVKAKKPGTRFYMAKYRSKNKNIEWKLTKQTYFALIQMECHYCNGYFQLQADQTGIGLDRIDRLKGYESGNVLPACGACNLTRGHRWTVEQTVVMIVAVIEYNKLNHLPPPSSMIAVSEEI